MTKTLFFIVFIILVGITLIFFVSTSVYYAFKQLNYDVFCREHGYARSILVQGDRIACVEPIVVFPYRGVDNEP